MSYWAVAQTVSTMEHLVRREIEKTNRGAFLPTYARSWKVDGKQYRKEYPQFLGYVFFLTEGDDWAGIPDIHGVYDVLATVNRSAKKVTETEMSRMVLNHAKGIHNEVSSARFTKYYRPAATKRKNSRKPRPGNRLRNFSVPESPRVGKSGTIVHSSDNGDVVDGLSAGLP